MYELFLCFLIDIYFNLRFNLFLDSLSHFLGKGLMESINNKIKINSFLVLSGRNDTPSKVSNRELNLEEKGNLE